MFTGLVEEMGIVEKIVPGKLMRIIVRVQKVNDQTKMGDSISVNGVCLTVTSIDKERLSFDVMKETQKKANFTLLRPGDGVNLERAMSANARFGGHIVSGHIDGVGVVRSKKSREGEFMLEIEADTQIISHLVPKGSICVDGVSLTVVGVHKQYFSIGFIPHTLKNTTLGFKEVGGRVNLEVDILSKYVFRYFQTKDSNTGKKTAPKSDITESYLRSQGFGD